jgi:hypothetical protein
LGRTEEEFVERRVEARADLPRDASPIRAVPILPLLILAVMGSACPRAKPASPTKTVPCTDRIEVFPDDEPLRPHRVIGQLVLSRPDVPTREGGRAQRSRVAEFRRLACAAGADALLLHRRPVTRDPSMGHLAIAPLLWRKSSVPVNIRYYASAIVWVREEELEGEPLPPEGEVTNGERVE